MQEMAISASRACEKLSCIQATTAARGGEMTSISFKRRKTSRVPRRLWISLAWNSGSGEKEILKIRVQRHLPRNEVRLSLAVWVARFRGGAKLGKPCGHDVFCGLHGFLQRHLG